MGLRRLLCVLLTLQLLYWTHVDASRNIRQDNSSPDSTFYQPPLLLNAAPQTIHNSYQPPLPQSRSNNEYRSPLSIPSQEYSASSYVPQHQPRSVQYIPPVADSSLSYSVLHQPESSVSSAASSLSQSTAERTYANSKIVGSPSAQSIQKAPPSETEVEKGSAAKEKDNKNEEYIVYYYYYYDNDTTAGNNASSANFDDIPSLESFDNSKETQKSPAASGNALNLDDSTRNSSQARSVSSSVNDAFIRADRPLVQPLKPVSNVHRYGSNEVPRFPILPNFIISEVPTTTIDSLLSQGHQFSSSSTTSASPNDASEDDSSNNVLDNTPDLKASEAKAAEEETTTTTTTEATTTVEVTTETTTEKPTRRRPSIGGSRRRFNPSPSSSFSSNRSRPPTRGSTSSSSTSTTTTSATPTRRSFQGSNRVRSRPSVGGSRTRTTEANEDNRSSVRSTTEASTVSSTTSRSRFSSSSPRRFQSSRSRSQTSSTTTSTRSPTSPRTRTTSRPRPNLITRNRPPRPGFLRPRPGSEPEEVETTTPVAEVVEETSPSGANEIISVATEDDSDENEETSEEEEEPTTTESNRFSALFRPRNRSNLGNRPRPVIGNRSARS